MNNFCPGLCGDNAKNKALAEITQVSFVIDELRLYLDTHENCAEALRMIKQYIAVRHDLMRNFTEKYGSLEAYSINDCNDWQWNAGPMPWEGDK